jgi:hypothetical protein
LPCTGLPEPKLTSSNPAIASSLRHTKWIDSIDLVESLGATTVIAGHKQPDVQRPGPRNDLRWESRLHPRFSRRGGGEQHRRGGHRRDDRQVPRLRKPHDPRVLSPRGVPRGLDGFADWLSLDRRAGLQMTFLGTGLGTGARFSGRLKALRGGGAARRRTNRVARKSALASAVSLAV